MRISSAPDLTDHDFFMHLTMCVSFLFLQHESGLGIEDETLSKPTHLMIFTVFL